MNRIYASINQTKLCGGRYENYVKLNATSNSFDSTVCACILATYIVYCMTIIGWEKGKTWIEKENPKRQQEFVYAFYSRFEPTDR